MAEPHQHSSLLHINLISISFLDPSNGSFVNNEDRNGCCHHYKDIQNLQLLIYGRLKL